MDSVNGKGGDDDIADAAEQLGEELHVELGAAMEEAATKALEQHDDEQEGDEAVEAQDPADDQQLQAAEAYATSLEKARLYKRRCKKLFPAQQRAASSFYWDQNSRGVALHKPVSSATIARQTDIPRDVGIALRSGRLDSVGVWATNARDSMPSLAPEEGGPSQSGGSSQSEQSQPDQSQSGQASTPRAQVATSVRSELHPVTLRLLTELELLPKQEVAKLHHEELYWLQRKIGHIMASITSFVRNKRNKVARRIVAQQSPSFTPLTVDLDWVLVCSDLHMREAEYLFYVFKSTCDFPNKQYWRLQDFARLFPASANQRFIEACFGIFKDRLHIHEGLEVVTWKSFIPTIAGFSRGSVDQRCQVIAHMCTVWHMGHLLPEFAHLAGPGQSVTIPYVTRARVEEVFVALQYARRLVILPEQQHDAKLNSTPLRASDFEMLGTDDDSGAPLRFSMSGDIRSGLDVTYDLAMDVELSRVHDIAEVDDQGNVHSLDHSDGCSTIHGRLVCLVPDDVPTQEVEDEMQNAIAQLFPQLNAKLRSSAVMTEDSCSAFEFCRRLQELSAQNAREPFWKQLLDGFGAFSYFHHLVMDSMTTDLADPAARGNKRIFKEGFLSKNSLRGPFVRWRDHWCCVGGGFFWYFDCDEEVPSLDRPERAVCLHRAKMKLSEDEPYRLTLSCGAYERSFRATNAVDFHEWTSAIISNMAPQPADASPQTAFSGPREGIDAVTYVDGKDMFAAVFKALSAAEEEVYISGWFITPELYLIREDEAGEVYLNEASRLDRLLLSLAERDVKVFVLPWSETKIVMNMGSDRAKLLLEGLHPNIRVLVHPLVSPVKWSHHQKVVVVDQDIAFVGGLDLAFGRYDDPSHTLKDVISNESIEKIALDHEQMPVWPGKDYYNPSVMGFEAVHEPWHDAIDRFKHPRMGWHDVHLSVTGYAARDVAFNFIQRWNHHKEDLSAGPKYPYLAPKTSLVRSLGTTRCQVLRSVGHWATGIGAEVEVSIYAAYLDAIENAKSFIYIENQYFISSLAGGVVKNRIAECLMKRISKAIEADEAFRVVIVLPVHPEGNLRSPVSAEQDNSVRYVMKWQAGTICDGEDSLLGQLKRKHPDVDLSRYLFFASLVSFALLNDTVHMEQVYVHSKLLVVDDRRCIIGSANINDRSMLGNRDSEICIDVQHSLEQAQSLMYGKPWKANPVVLDLRKKLWAEHLGILGEGEGLGPVEDPLAAYGHFVQTAENNATLYKQLFPDRNKPVCALTPEVHDTLQQVQGHIVTYDYEYLVSEARRFSGAVTMSDDVYV